MPQTSAGNLGTQLGQLLFGQQDDGKAYSQGQAVGALVDDRMASARRARAAAMIDEDRLGARQGITPDAMTAAGFASDQAPLLGSILRANDTVNLANLGDLQRPVAGQAMVDARDALKGGNVELGNLMLALAQGKPLETTKVTEGQVFNPYNDPGQHIALTALGDATVREKGASAADKYASAGAHNAQARLYGVQADAGGFNPHTGKSGPYTYPSAPDAAAYLGDAHNAAAFTAWRSQHPEIKDGNEAWIAFRAARPIGAPTGEPADGDGTAPIYDAPGAVDLAKLGEELVAQAPAAAPAPAAGQARQVVRTGTAKDGRKVVQYADGIVDYAD